MSSQNKMEEQDDVVVIEERDKRTHIYIAIAAVLGLAFGGLVGAVVTANKWESTYHVLEEKYQALTQDKTQLASQVKVREEALDQEIQNQVSELLAAKDEAHQKALKKLQKQLTEVEKVNLSLESQLKQQADKINTTKSENEKLSRQADMQATMFERSREVFQKELKISQELESLEKERSKLLPKIEKLKKECDVFLEGKSWDVKSDACDKHDEANSRLSQVDQMIEVYKMDLKQIKAITEDIGL
ncbi:chromosome partitioning protein ParA [Vibrio alginolyticus]|uniref:chromosome partitioning protein ParA n=1 Tax=Vibrio TaxID=662 RepID=UPI000302E28C|nr:MULTISPECIES: chromosome partitioning protein ParA [Vibrio]EGQ9179972.1 chromosome partitioning protein ParA [Vibrio alginolyticus]EGQ9761426.1 chromosome partitioning protein ParA [Vibrio alginolyticus]EIK0771078.1 chromosome partitioning protein ParA [Vibrio alginolyticus]EIL2908814.1 chromosome partitioning protein ParA [Vibrio alginolyticus]EKZ8663093.1 chromosome partitioning protein ParA [Vibrio alginolyticus]